VSVNTEQTSTGGGGQGEAGARKGQPPRRPSKAETPPPDFVPEEGHIIDRLA
jgi:hypothetical protein